MNLTSNEILELRKILLKLKSEIFVEKQLGLSLFQTSTIFDKIYNELNNIDPMLTYLILYPDINFLSSNSLLVYVLSEILYNSDKPFSSNLRLQELLSMSNEAFGYK